VRRHQVSYPGYLHLEVHGKILQGRLHTVLHDNDCRPLPYEQMFEMSGVIHDRFARLEYASKVKSALTFGAMILELSTDATELKGNFVAFGLYSKRIITGRIEFQKTR
jgi:hypothetical protein